MEKEEKVIGPYPAWDKWKYSLLDHLKSKGYEAVLNSAEEVLHKWYVVRRKEQLGIVGENERSDFARKIQEEHSQIFDIPFVVEAFRYITERTTRIPKEEKRRH